MTTKHYTERSALTADEQDWNPKDPEEKERIDETFERMMDPNSGYFGG